MLAIKILGGYFMAGVLLAIPLGYMTLLGPKTKESNTPLIFLGRVFLFLLLMMLFWPLLAPVFLDGEWGRAKEAVLSIYDHYRYSRTSDAAKVRRLLQVYGVFKRYRPRTREEKLLRATVGVYFEVTRWRKRQADDALGLIEPRIGTDIVNLRDLAKAILSLKKPCLGSLSAPDYEDKFRATGRKDATIDLVLSERSADRPHVPR